MATDPCSRQLDGVNPPSISPSPPVFATRWDITMIPTIVLIAVFLLLFAVMFYLLERRRREAADSDSARRHLSRRLAAADSAPRYLSRCPAADKGLEKKVLKSLPKQLITYSHGRSYCAICLSEFAAGDRIRLLWPCNHGFHVGCIDTWYGSHSSCPSCRSENNDVVIKVSDENFS